MDNQFRVIGIITFMNPKFLFCFWILLLNIVNIECIINLVIITMIDNVVTTSEDNNRERLYKI